LLANVTPLAGPAAGPSYLAKVGLNGNLALFFQFPPGDNPGAVLYGADGNYYGTANNGSTGFVYVYRVTPSGALTKLHNTNATGASYLIQGTDGNLYGLTTSIAGSDLFHRV
jgi:hypothetical protein